MTTEEFLQSLKGGEILSGQQKNLLKDFLECSDMVKFARYAPTEDEIRSVYDAAVSFVDETKEGDHEIS